MRKKVLIIENERSVLDILSLVLGREGYEVMRASNGLLGIRIAAEESPDVIIVDMDPAFSDLAQVMDNSELCRCLRKSSLTVPILVFTASYEVEKELLDSGASECIRIPFEMDELLLRIRANTWHLDSSPARSPNAPKRLILGRIIIDFDKATISKDGETLNLSPREYDLMCFMAQHPGQVLSREELLYYVWDYKGFLGDLRAVDVCIRRLREKIEDDPADPAIIVTRKGRGYIIAL